jgi:hypothetical protein
MMCTRGTHLSIKKIVAPLWMLLRNPLRDQRWRCPYALIEGSKLDTVQ